MTWITLFILISLRYWFIDFQRYLLDKKQSPADRFYRANLLGEQKAQHRYTTLFKWATLGYIVLGIVCLIEIVKPYVGN